MTVIALVLGTRPRLGASVISHAKGYILSCRTNGRIFSAARPRSTLAMMSSADFVQTKGFGSALLWSM